MGCSISSIHCFHELVIPGVSQVQDKVALNTKEETTHNEADSSPNVVELVWNEITHDVEGDQDEELHTPETIMESTAASIGTTSTVARTSMIASQTMRSS